MNFGIVVFNQVEELDFVGPWEMLSMWRQHAGGPQNCLIVAQSLDPVSCAKGLSINPHVAFADCPPLDYLLVPGGQGTRREVDNPQLIAFVAGQAKGCQAVLSVCTGAFVLHAAGLLAGRRATTHWRSLDRLRALGDVSVVEQRYVQDGKVWSSAGVSAGTDLLLAFIASVAGDAAAGQVQLAAEYYPECVNYGGCEMHAHPQAPAYIRRRLPLVADAASEQAGRAGYRLRAARVDDADEIARLCGELGYPATSAALRANLELLLASPRHLLAVAATDEQRLGGWLAVERRVTLESGEQAELTGLVVAAAARRRGVGRALVAAAEQWCVGQGLASLRVRSNVARAESHPFYAQLGFVRRKTQHCYDKPLPAAAVAAAG